MAGTCTEQLLHDTTVNKVKTNNQTRCSSKGVEKHSWEILLRYDAVHLQRAY